MNIGLKALTLCAAIVATAAVSMVAPAYAAQLPVDPCSLIASPNLASVLGTTIGQIGTPQHPSADECAWAVAGRGGTGVQRVVLTVETAQAARSCRGIGCALLAQSILSTVSGANVFNSTVTQALEGAQLVAGLGDRAGWKDGWLTVVKNQVAFRLMVSGSGSDANRLAMSENLASSVLSRL